MMKKLTRTLIYFSLWLRGYSVQFDDNPSGYIDSYAPEMTVYKNGNIEMNYDSMPSLKSWFLYYLKEHPKISNAYCLKPDNSCTFPDNNHDKHPKG